MGGVGERRQVGGEEAEEETIFCRGKGEVEVDGSRVCSSWYVTSKGMIYKSLLFYLCSLHTLPLLSLA